MDTPAGPRVVEEDGDSVRRRPRWSAQKKLQIVLETLERGVSVPVIARRHSLNANQLFSWRSQYRRGELTADGESPRVAKLLPVRVEASAVSTTTAGQGTEGEPPSSTCLEIQFCGVRHVKIRARLTHEHYEW